MPQFALYYTPKACSFAPHVIKEDLTKWPAHVDYYARLAARPSIAAALGAEGLEP